MKTNLLILGIFLTNLIYAQVPTITGNFMLCPNGVSTLSTQVYDTYQWKKREFGSSNINNITGGVNQTLTIDEYNYSVSYISVQVTINGESFTSNEVFIDSNVFLNITVQIDGNYSINPNNGDITLANPNDYVIFTVLNPYDNDFKWYKDDVLIPNQITNSIQVNLPGVYYVSASPSPCLDYLQTSLPLIVQAGNLDNEVLEFKSPTIFPNPVQNIINIQTQETIIEASVYDILGKKVKVNQVTTSSLDVSNLAQGIYMIKVIVENHKTLSSKFIKN